MEWIYLFSQFTEEALLFEGLVLFSLICGYTLFWLIRKRRYGITQQAIPAAPVQIFLNDLITSSEKLHIQLFGMIAHSKLKKNLEKIKITQEEEIHALQTKIQNLEAQLKKYESMKTK